MKALLLLSVAGICFLSGSVALAGDALDSFIKCDNVKGGTKKKGEDGNLFTVFIRSEGVTRDAKVDIITKVATTKKMSVGGTVHFPSSASKLVNSWMDLNEAKAWYMATARDGSLIVSTDEEGNVEGQIVLYVKLKQAQSVDPGVDGMIYKGEVESKKESGLKVYDKAVVCLCGTGVTKNTAGFMDYSMWKQTTCTPNSK